MSIRVAVLDDHRSFGESLCLAISAVEDLQCLGVTTCVDDCVALIQSQLIDVVLVDYQLAEGSGLDFVAHARVVQPESQVVLLTAHASADVEARARANGVGRVLSKDEGLHEIIAAVRAAAGQPAPRTNGTTAAASTPARTERVVFSARQREALELMGDGLGPTEIAEKLFISIHTARGHVKNVMRLLDAPTQLAAVTKAQREGYLVPPKPRFDES